MNSLQKQIGIRVCLIVNVKVNKGRLKISNDNGRTSLYISLHYNFKCDSWTLVAIKRCKVTRDSLYVPLVTNRAGIKR